MREKYESLSLAALKDLAKARGLKGVTAMRKAELIEVMLEEDERTKPIQEEERDTENETEKTDVVKQTRPENRENNRENIRYERNEYRERRDYRDMREQKGDEPPTDIGQLDSGQTVKGILEVMSDGYGFIRSANYLPGENDVYVSPSQIRRFNLKTGDIIEGNTRIKTQSEKFSALLYLTKINGFTPAQAAGRYNFEDMTPIFPNQRIRLESGGSSTAMRVVDLLSPIGKGQRGMIVSPPKAGKTTLLKEVALSIKRNHPETHLLILLIDERPEEVTDIKEAIEGKNVEVIYSTFDELPEHHKRVSEMVLDTVGLRADGYPDNTYQVLREWGCDILSVANSFGLGGIAIQLQDTLLRMGVEQKDTVDIIDSSHFEVIAEGPVRSVFRLDFTRWDVLGTKVDVHETVTIWAGKNGYEEEIRTSPLPENAVLVTGLVGNNNTKEFVEKQYAGKWVSMITHDKQTVNKDYELGMALLIPKDQLVETFHAPDEGNGILKTWCAKLKPGNNGYRYQVYAGWELGVDDFSKREEFIRLVDTYADYLNHPVSIHIN